MEYTDHEQDSAISQSEEELFLKEVIQGDAELLYLDTYLTELFS